MNSDVKFYIALLLKRLPVMLVIFILCAGLGVGLAVTLPSRYAADARLLVESAQIPDELAASTVRTAAAEQLEIIEQRLMTRANLIDIANKFKVFPQGSAMTPDDVVTLMRELTEIEMTSGRDRATLMTISFRSGDAQTSADVVNEFVTLILSADSQRRQGLAGQTLDFFEQEVERLSLELTDRSARIVAFKESNKDALPESLDYRLDRQSQLQERLNISARDRAALNEQRTRLLAIGTVGTNAVPGITQTPEQIQLATLKSELNSALSVYSDTNPRVILLKTRIEQLEKSMSARPVDDTSTEVVAVDPAQRVLDLQLSEIDSRIAFIDSQSAKDEAELARLLDAIERTPENAIRLEALEREYESTQRRYNEATSGLAKAQTGERIEVLSKGERVSVIEQAVPPSQPNSPNRTLIAGGGVFLGTALAVAFFVLTELLNRAIRRPIDLVRGLGIQPLATIPYLEEETTKRRRRAFSTIVIAGLMIAIPIALWAVHTFYLPLDLLVDKALGALGL